MSDRDQIELEIDRAIAWVDRLKAVEAERDDLQRRVWGYANWISAYDKFVLEGRTLGEHRNVREAVKAFAEEKGYGLPSL